MKSSLVSMKKASKSFGGVRAVRDVSIDIEAGGIIALVGPNGAGKSTLFDLMTGVQKLDSGQRIVAGRDMTSSASHQIANVGISRTFQKVRLFPTMTALENVLI